MNVNKIILVTIISVFIGCKNEKQNSENKLSNDSKSVENNVSGVKNNTEIQNDDILKNIPLKTAFITQENGKKKFEFNLEKGKTYPYVIREVEQQKMSAQGKSESMTNESVDDLTFKVEDIKDDKYMLLVTFNSKQTSVKAQGKTFTIDTNKPSPSDPEMAKTYRLHSALVKNSFNMELTKSGQVSNIKGMEKIYDKVSNTLKKELKKEELKFIVDAIKQTFNPEIFKKQFEAILITYPKNGISEGEKWTNRPKTSLTDINYQLVKLDDNQANIKISSFIKPESKKESKDGVTFSASINGSQQGNIFLDSNSGWIKNGKLITTVIQKQKISDQTKSQEIIKEIISSTFINQ